MSVRRSRSTGRNVAYMGILAAIAILCGYIETLIPFAFGIPGMKLGLANIVTVSVLYLFGAGEAAVVSAVRILTVSILFGSPYSLLYSAAGGAFSLIGMILLQKVRQLSMTGVSIAGGIMHNIGQLIVAAFVVNELRLTYYIPFLIIAGAVTGLLIGIVSRLLTLRLQQVISRTDDGSYMEESR